MTTPGIDEWLASVGFSPIDQAADADDPWAGLDVAVTPLTDEQRAHLVGSPTFDEGPVDPTLLADADEAVIEIPDDPDDVEPF